MRQLCWECRERAASAQSGESSSHADQSVDALMAQVYEIVREYESGSV
jgi:hypothetical protein